MKKCRQCWLQKPDDAFVRGDGRVVLTCVDCRAKFKAYEAARKVGDAFRFNTPRLGLRAGLAALRVSFARTSGNEKLGPIPASMTSSETCPPSCAFFGEGCFAEFGVTRYHWQRTPDRGFTWDEFVSLIARLPKGALWRHNVAGDLPGTGTSLDRDALYQLVLANRGRRGFTFTHKPLTDPRDLAAVALANDLGFTINLSADSLADADRLAARGGAPIAVVLPSSASARATRTPAGRPIVVCPPETHALTCERCQLCSKPRVAIVGFRAHGQMRRRVDELVQLRRPS